MTEDKVDLARAECAMREFLTAVGVDLAAQGMEETPARAAALYAELFAGLHTDTQDLWADVLTEKTDGLIADPFPFTLSVSTTYSRSLGRHILSIVRTQDVWRGLVFSRASLHAWHNVHSCRSG